MVESFLVVLDLVDLLAERLYPANATTAIIDDDLPYGVPSPKPIDYVQVDVAGRGIPYNSFCDAVLGIRVFWMFTDPNVQEHSLKITAELDYWDPIDTVSTSVNLKMTSDEADTITANPREITEGFHRGSLATLVDTNDYYKINLTSPYTAISISMTPLNVCDFDLYIYGSSYNLLAQSCTRQYGATENVAYYASPGWLYIRIK